ncbi:hypothetical protein ACHAXH_005782 [Discostella pseudostelligera]
MSSPASHHRHQHSRPAKVHSPSTSSGVDKRRKLMHHPAVFGSGGGGSPPNGAAYPQHQGYYMFAPDAGSEGGGIPEEGPGAAGPPPLPLPPSHGYGYAPPIHQHPGSAAAGHHHPPPPPHDPYYINRTGSAAGGPPPGEGYYLGPPPPPPHSGGKGAPYGAPPPSMIHPLSGEHNGRNKIHQPRGHNNNLPLRLSPHQYNNGGGSGEEDYENSSASKSPPKVLLHQLPGTSPGATNNGDENNGSETTPTSVMANDDTLDTRSPEGSRNLNPLEERVQGITDNHSDEQRHHQQQQQQQQAITRSSSGTAITSSTPGKGGGQVPHVAHNPTGAPSSMVKMPPYHGMHPPPLPPPGMAPYHGPPSHQGMYHQYPHNRHHLHPYMSPTIVPQSSHHHHGGAFPSHTHQPHPPHHPAAHHPGVPQFLPQFHMSPQHHRNALPRGSGDSNMTPGQMSPRGRGSDRMMMVPPPHPPAMLGGPLPPSSSPSSTTTRVINSNGETIWTCEYCNLKFNTWEDCAAHEEGDCPAAAYHHHNRHHHQPRPHLQGYGPPPLGQYPMHGMHSGMMHPGHDNVLSGNEHIQPYSDVGRNAHNRSLKGRKMALSAFPNNGHLFVDQNVEYAVNTDRVTYLFSTSSDVDSLSDRQCYVRTHFVEIFVATAADVGARHSRGAQMLNLGQIGLRCAYCVKLRQRDRAERAICYPSSISRIYQTVADMQRFHFESCVAIPPKVLHAYRSLKTTRPRGVGSPQSYWDQSARDIGLVDSKYGIQVADEDVKFEMQRKSVVTGMLAIMDGPNDASRDALIMQDMLARQEDASEEEGKQYEVSSFQPHQDPQAMQAHEATIQAAVVSSPGSDTGSKAEDEDGNFGVTPSTPKTAKDVEAEEDANILLMLKKTPESPPRVDSLEGSNSSGSIEYATNDGINPTVNVDGFVAV